MKLCVKCGQNPRHVTRSGNELFKCHACMQEEWRKYKSPHLNGERAYGNGKTVTRTRKPKQAQQPKQPKKAKQAEQVIRPFEHQTDLQRELIRSRHQIAKIKRAIKAAETLEQIKKLIGDLA